MRKLDLEKFVGEFGVSVMSESEKIKNMIMDFFTVLESEFEALRVIERENEKLFSPYFCVLDIMNLDENSVSDIIAFLLDPTETHGQGLAFVGEFISILNQRYEFDIVFPEALEDVKVFREYYIYDKKFPRVKGGRIDIAVRIKETFS